MEVESIKSQLKLKEEEKR